MSNSSRSPLILASFSLFALAAAAWAPTKSLWHLFRHFHASVFRLAPK